MNILESEFEDVIFNAIETNPELLRSKNFPCYPGETYLRQVDLGAYGRADLIGFNVYRNEYNERVIEVSIYELKKEEITATQFFQAVRYAKAIERIFEEAPNFNISYSLKFYFYLIGKYINTKSDLIFLTDIVSEVHFYTYHLDLEKGLKFNEVNGYRLVNENFGKRFYEKGLSFLKSVIRKRVRYWNEKRNKNKSSDFDKVDDLPF